MADLPSSVNPFIERLPIEDFFLALLRPMFPDVLITASYELPQSIPAIVLRRDPAFGMFREDTRWIDSARISFSALCSDPDGDRDAALLSEAIRVAVRRAWLDQVVIPGIGHLSWVDMKSPGRRASDFATATGPVQYADLPTGVYRYESIIEVELRLAANRLRDFHY